MFHWIAVAVIGLIAGTLAKMIMPGKDGGGWIVTALLGIAGSFLATWVGEHFGIVPAAGLMHFVASVVGAVILLAIYHVIQRARAS